MKVPTSNVVVSFSRDTIEELFAKGSTYKNLLKKIQKTEDTLLFTGTNNPNFLSFEHSLNLGPDGPVMILTLIDPKHEFESRFMNANILDNVAGMFTENGSQDCIGNTDEVHWNGATQLSIEDVDVNTFKKLFQHKVRNRFIYFAYGSGDNLDTWAGPHVMVLVACDITYEGVKKFTLKFAPFTSYLNALGRRGAYNEVVDLDLEGLTMEVGGRSRFLNFEDPSLPVYLPDISYSVEGQTEILTQLDLVDLADALEKIDFHVMVVDVIRNYIQKALQTKNVIVLLPNLNYICSEALSQLGFVSRFFKSEPPEAPKKGSFAYDAIRALNENYSNLIKNPAVKAAYTSMAGLFLGTGRKDFIELGLNRLGVDLVSISKSDVESGALSALPDGAVAWRVLMEEGGPTPGDRVVNYIQNNEFFARKLQQSAKGIPDHMAALKSIQDNILAASKGVYSPRFGQFSESDVNILKLWEEEGKDLPYSIFGGACQFSSDSPALVYGDLNLITKFLYGKISLEALEETASEITTAANNAEHLGFLPSPEGPGGPGAGASLYKQAENLAPFHPLDKALLTNQSYNKKVRAIINPTREGTYPYGNPSILPDDFEHIEEFDEEQQKYITESNIPIFKCNTKNPNVTDLKFKFGPIYFAMLQQGYRRDVQRKAAAVGEGVIESKFAEFPITTEGAAIAYVVSRLNSWGDPLSLAEGAGVDIAKELQEKISPDMYAKFDGATVTAKQAATVQEIFTMINKFATKVDKPIIVLKQLLPGNPAAIMANFSDQVYRNALRMDIKTLPLFHLSNFSTITNECAVLAQNTVIIQNDAPESSLLDKFFSGLYQILGFKHTISNKESLSEFKLSKLSTSEPPEDIGVYDLGATVAQAVENGE